MSNENLPLYRVQGFKIGEVNPPEIGKAATRTNLVCNRVAGLPNVKNDCVCAQMGQGLGHMLPDTACRSSYHGNAAIDRARLEVQLV